jgi:ferric-dicitrate binding protein FerR (iron transport regulator)
MLVMGNVWSMDPSVPPTFPPPPPAWEALDAYLAGELDGPAADAVRRYLAHNPDVERTLHERAAFVPRRHAPAHDVDVRAAWHAMEQRIGASTSIEKRPVQVGARVAVRQKRVAPLVAGLATVALLAAATVIGLVKGGTWFDGSHTRATSEYATRPGERATVQLADGSTVLLGPASHLVVTREGASVRETRLSGEAYFTVRSRADAPFIVHAGDGIVRVLGTEFAVRRYDTDSTVRVAVATGRVSLRARTDGDGIGVVLGASDAAQLGPKNRVVVTRGVDLTDDLSWRTGQLRFRNATVASVLTDLGRAYDLELTVSDSALAHLHITATLHQTTAAGMLDVLSRLLNADVRRSGRHVTLIKRGAL